MNYIFSIKGITNIATKFFSQKLHRSAAAFSYFLTMSIFPMLICIQWILGTFGENIISFLNEFSHIIPENIIAIFTDYLEYAGSRPARLLSVGIITAVYTGAAAYRMISDLLREIFGTVGGNSIFRFIFSFVGCVLFLIVIYVSVIAVLAGKWLINLLEPIFLKIEFINLLDLAELWNWFRFVILIIIIAGALHALYLSAAWHNPKAKNTLPGAVIASLLMAIVSAIFSAVISSSVKYSLVYGSLASVIVLLFWLYILGNIIIIGALINQEINEQSSDTKMNYHKDITKFIKKDD
ncbi:MAG: YihY/virulence factor BrkB family protein [Oscillospiraceae bacterium]